ncbi:uracil-DNA glycosylase [Methylobacillus sp.]|uniref:uracil-DNA glycosylase n=1 Tax=Methylobacillus sp. TaxID=56818 RepID=UPI002FE2255B
MSLTREDMLRELELLPIWKLRVPPVPAKTEVEIKPVLAEPAIGLIEPEAAQPIELVPVVAVEEATVTAPASQETDDAPAEAASMDEPPIYDTENMPVWEEYAASVGPDWANAEQVDTPVKDRRTEIMALDWQALQATVQECNACSLHATRTQAVFGVGDPQAEWLFIGEAPGVEEDRRGEPFVGPAGKLLDNMLAAIKLKRGENVYIANVLKCRPPANRDPHGEEVVKCDLYLKRQVELIQPKLIVALGKFAAQSLLSSDKSIAGLRGKLHDFHGVPVVVTYHPAYLLRNMPDKAKAWDDLCFARETMQGLQSAVAAPSGQ